MYITYVRTVLGASITGHIPTTHMSESTKIFGHNRCIDPSTSSSSSVYLDWRGFIKTQDYCVKVRVRITSAPQDEPNQLRVVVSLVYEIGYPNKIKTTMFSRQHLSADTAPPSSSLVRRPFLRKATAQQPALRSGDVLKDSSTKKTMQPVEPTNSTSSNSDEQVEIPAMRNRLDTGDTLRMSNLNLPDLLLDEDNPFLECHENYSPEAIQRAKRRSSRQARTSVSEASKVHVMDCESTVSSLSAGSFKQRPPPPSTVAGSQHQPALVTPRTAQSPIQQVPPSQEPKFVPPKMVCFRVKTEVPDWLLEDDDDAIDHPDQDVEDLNRSNSLRTEDDDTAENHPHPHWSPLPHARVAHQRRHQQQCGPPPRSPQPFTRQQQVPQTPRQHHQQQQPNLSPVWTGMASPINVRPSMGRYKSVSCANIFPATTPRPNTAQEVVPLSPCINTPRYSNSPRRSVLTPRTLPPPHSTPHLLLTPTSSSPITTTHHKHHKRIVSLGETSLLESLWTAPTAASSSHSLSHHPNSVHARRTSAVVQELRSLWSRMRGNSNRSVILIPELSSSSKDESWNKLQLSEGCLT